MKSILLDQLVLALIFMRLSLQAIEPNLIAYNTTSGVYLAEEVELDGYEFNNVVDRNQNSVPPPPIIVHRLTSVPYGEKPGRFEKARMKKYEEGVHDPRPLISCYQSVNLSSYGAFNLLHPPLMSEDCLTVNLYIPVGRKRNGSNYDDADYRNLSVVVHIHGGSNMVGGAGLFDGSILAAHGRIIVAVINYRLSILGFLSDMTHKYPGNYGLRDQLLAIKWLKLNCPRLNCNPDSITLWGHSAGAGDVNWLALSPLSNHLFQRVIIQSGSAFTYWGFDKLPHERYKSLRAYFNCTRAPAEYTAHNRAMTILIDACLKNTTLDDLFSFKFALIDAPGPIYDGFLGAENAFIIRPSPKEMLMDDKNRIVNLDIMTGINGVEGFSFEGYFADSVSFWTKSNLTSEVALTMERLSLLTREKCLQNSIIGNRHKFEEFYENKVKKYMSSDGDMKSEEARRLKAIFANSDAIFDSGFIEFLHLIATKKTDMMRRGLLNKSNLFVYEYLHENSGSEPNFKSFKKLLNYTLSTHFDGIDLLFGLPIAYKYRKKSKKVYNPYPFKDFIFESKFSEDDVALSLVLIKYYSNFIKNGNPNVGVKVPKKWEPYMNNKSYLVLDKSLSDSTMTTSVLSQEQTSKIRDESKANQTTTPYRGIREDLYNFWFVELDKNGRCSSYPRHQYHHYHSRSSYNSSRHTQGRDAALDACLARLDRHDEYNYLREMFLIEYENCINSGSSLPAGVERIRILLNTVCLDIIAVRRMLIEYQESCIPSSPNITSTICSFDKNFNTSFIGYKVKDLIKYVITSYSSSASYSKFDRVHFYLFSSSLAMSFSDLSSALLVLFSLTNYFINIL